MPDAEGSYSHQKFVANVTIHGSKEERREAQLGLMDMVRALEHAPEDAAAIVAEIYREDSSIAVLSQKADPASPTRSCGLIA